MSKHKNREKVFLTLDPNKMVIKCNNKECTDISIIANIGKYSIEIGRYKDDDKEYLTNRVMEILQYIQD